MVFGVVYTSASVSLSERNQELATMRMLGFTRWEVSYVLLGELALLTAAAVPLGLAAGYALAWKMTEGISNEIFRLPLHMERFSFGYAIVSVLAAVVLSAAVVVVKIFRLDLISLLKTRE
jgi:putative ABC transport system permease protein